MSFRLMATTLCYIPVLLISGCRKDPADELTYHQDSRGPDSQQADTSTAEAAAPEISSPVSSFVRLATEPHWKKMESNVYGEVYMGSPGDVHYVRSLVDDLPPADPEDIDQQRKFFRNFCIKENGGIISVESEKIHEHQCVVVFSKQVVPKIRGYRYVARAYFSHDEKWTEVRMDAIQMGMTGKREAIASTSLGGDVQLEDVPEDAAPTPAPGAPAKPGDKRIKGFYFDPYDAEFNSSAMNSIADAPQYDTVDAQHPLTRLRRTFPAILQNLEFQAAEL